MAFPWQSNFIANELNSRMDSHCLQRYPDHRSFFSLLSPLHYRKTKLTAVTFCLTEENKKKDVLLKIFNCGHLCQNLQDNWPTVTLLLHWQLRIPLIPALKQTAGCDTPPNWQQDQQKLMPAMKKCQPRHPDATLRGTPLEMSHGKLTWYWGDKHCERPTFKEAEECQRNVAFYIIKCFVEKTIGKEMSLSRLPSFFLWPSASRSRNEKKCPSLHVQRCPESFNETDMKWREVIPPLMLLTLDPQTYNVLEPTMATTGLDISMQEMGPHTRKGPLT